MDYPWYTTVAKSRPLEQGDFIFDMNVPRVIYTAEKAAKMEDAKIQWTCADWVIMTQSCDLNPKNKKAPGYVMLCPVSQFPTGQSKNKVADVLRNRNVATHALKPADHPISDNHYLVVDFKEARIAKLSAVKAHARAKGNGPRLRLNSPYLENMSKRFGNYYSRIAYPIDLPDEYDIPNYLVGQ